MWKEEERVVWRKPSIKEGNEIEGSSVGQTITVLSLPRSPRKNIPSSVELKSESKISSSGDSVSVQKQSTDSPKLTYESAWLLYPVEVAVMSKPGTYKTSAPDPSEKPSSQPAVLVATEKPSTQLVHVIPRPLSAPFVPGPRPVVLFVSMIQTPLLLACSVRAAGWLGPEPSTAAHKYVRKSYRNVMMGYLFTGSSVGFTQPHPPSSRVNSLHSYSQPLSALLSDLCFCPKGLRGCKQTLTKQAFHLLPI